MDILGSGDHPIPNEDRTATIQPLPTPQNSALTLTSMSTSDEALSPSETTTAIASNVNTNKKPKKKKPRYSKAKKKELKQLKIEQEDEERKFKRNQKRKRTTSTTTPEKQPPIATQPKKRKKQPKEPKDKIDRILLCAENSLFTDSIVVENKDDVVTDAGETANDENNNKNNNNDGENDSTKNQRLIVKIVSGCDLSKHAADESPSSSSSSMEITTKPEPLLPLTISPGHPLVARKTTCTIKVQPLLVLDLNGILCHRDRKRNRKKLPADTKLRPSVGNVANSAIIPRTDLLEFLYYLDQYFCLAIWTSAKPKTAKKLLNMLLSSDGPKPKQHKHEIRKKTNNDDRKGIRSRLLFVWSQTQCTEVRSPWSGKKEIEADQGIANVDVDDDEHSYDDSIVFEKHLPKIWEAYPLWSANNTLLVDDSPEKCPLTMANSVHPPPLHGRQPTSSSSSGHLATPRNDDPAAFALPLADQDNEDQQACFFRKLVSFWTDRRFVAQQYTTEAERATTTTTVQTKKDITGPGAEEGETSEAMTNTMYYEFLQTHARGHMGWREPTTVQKTDIEGDSK